MLERSNTERVLCPEISIATLSGTPARTRFLTAVLRWSWNSLSTPAFRQAAVHPARIPQIGLPRYVNTHSPLRSSLSRAESASEAIGMTLPHGITNKSLVLGGNTLSTANLDYQNISAKANQVYDDFLTKELAYDLGVDVRLLRDQLRSLF